MKGVYIFLADGFEETEALATLDVLRRGKVDVETVAIEKNWDHEEDEADFIVTGSHGVPVIADYAFEDFEEMIEKEGTSPEDVMIFPGGLPGSEYLAKDEKIIALMKEHYAAGGTVAAICAAPSLVAAQLPGLQGVKATCYDGMEANLIAAGADYKLAPAVTDGRLITGRGPGYAFDFGFAILTRVKGQKVTDLVRAGMLIGK